MPSLASVALLLAVKERLPQRNQFWVLPPLPLLLVLWAAVRLMELQELRREVRWPARS